MPFQIWKEKAIYFSWSYHDLCCCDCYKISADIGYLFGDTKEHCRDFKGTRTGAAIVFVIGFWILDLANNTVQGPARALLADLSGPQQSNSANAIFCSWMAVGNVLGFSAGSTGNWHRWLPFLTTKACCEACGNLKGGLLVAVYETFATCDAFGAAHHGPYLAVISFLSIKGNAPLKTASYVLFAFLGFPHSVTYSVPFSVTAELTADTGGGQDDRISWSRPMGRSAFVSGILAIKKLPHLSRNSYKSSGFHGFG
ncbi:Sucrose transport protein SUC3 [Acorus calamus]|uniref:Sucrose transport protein SUC3 n=1 Tax=Acorus calamus TaxID=4465 RepID=A0AAV9E6U9_ACOCL|nr:Sucrose transport protein SUC3 [Acorus calamus]